MSSELVTAQLLIVPCHLDFMIRSDLILNKIGAQLPLACLKRTDVRKEWKMLE